MSSIEIFRGLLSSTPKAAAMLPKLVLHRGWHASPHCHGDRPIENTRQAYLDAIETGAKFAECDAWATRDGVVILNHDSRLHLRDPCLAETIGQTDLLDLDFDTIKDLELINGSTPTTLQEVLHDLLGTETKLVLELKGPSAARQVVEFLAANKEYLSAVAWIFSFSFPALRIVKQTMAKCGDADVAAVPVHFIVDNPPTPYSDPSPDQTTLDVINGQLLEDFLVSQGFLDEFKAYKLGLYLQYNALLTPAHVQHVRSQLAAIHNTAEESTFMGMWADLKINPTFDRLEVMAPYAEILDVVNSDFPTAFFEALPVATGTDTAVSMATSTVTGTDIDTETPTSPVDPAYPMRGPSPLLSTTIPGESLFPRVIPIEIL